MMKILRIKVNGLPLYKAPFDISFLATQRIQSNHLDSVYKLFGNIYVNTAEAFVGINASGKSTALKAITFTKLLLSAYHMSAGYVPKILGEDTKTVFDIYFFDDEKIYYLSSELVKSSTEQGDNVKILAEKLLIKNADRKVTKKNIFDFSNIDPEIVRDNSKEHEYLSDDVSIMIAIIKNKTNKNEKINKNEIYDSFDLSLVTNYSMYFPDKTRVPNEVLKLLDPTIEYINFEKVGEGVNSRKEGIGRIRLKFYGQDELKLYNADELIAYLSAGTVKGMTVFLEAIKVLGSGGYMIIDEIENHFNRVLVESLIRLFMSKRTNSKGAVIIFSTHYPELLDELVRNDSVFITKNDGGLYVENLSSLLSRNDMKKSEVYKSNYLGGTAPKYEALEALQRYMSSREVG
jgi:hypothetical protein